MPETTFAERLKIALDGEKPGTFASRVGIGDSTIRKYLQGTIPLVDKAAELARALNVNLDWLAAEQGSMRPGEMQPHYLPVDDAGMPVGFISVPKIEIRPSAGAGSLDLYQESEPDIFAFREEWLRRIGVSPKFARLMVAKGDSMRETINDGDLMIVDVSIREFIDEAIYVLVYGGLVRLKRLQMLRTGLLLLKSDNPMYQTEEVPLAEQPELIIGGRVRWAGGAI
ncbi:helix-turn-helix transcriptional regulator [Mesorhizobium sp. ES1-1]|uniref:LexA family transcriptional regulator n=1 Tax=Mesorhizobium sp. ES1-1 TaxID=2876629 RepID=UPI001CC8F0F1|nr:XRE family transcriptional regulator [Mesorhizobium sp. ES1-1]MBZ9678936.1 helix-turn-helix domain-containing protein [Mesorhizobium sp. ES1-1]